MADDDKGKAATKAGTFWGTVIATVLLSLVGSGGLSTLLNRGHTDDVTQSAHEKAKTTAAAHAKEHTDKSERAFAMYLDALRPHIDAELDRIDDNVERLDDDLDECIKVAREAEKHAYAALVIAESRYGRRVVERSLARIEDDEKPPTAGPPEPRVRRGKKKLPSYRLRR